MDEQDLKLLLDWFSEHKDDKLNFLAKEAIKLEVKRANTVELTIHCEQGIMPFIFRRS